MSEWWKETHGDAPDTVFEGLEWRPVPGVLQTWESPYLAPLDWQLMRDSSGTVDLDWLGDTRVFENEGKAVEFIRERLRKLRADLAGLAV